MQQESAESQEVQNIKSDNEGYKQNKSTRLFIDNKAGSAQNLLKKLIQRTWVTLENIKSANGRITANCS